MWRIEHSIGGAVSNYGCLQTKALTFMSYSLCDMDLIKLSRKLEASRLYDDYLEYHVSSSCVCLRATP